MEMSEANLKATLEKVEDLETYKKRMKEDMSACTAAVEALKLELPTMQALSREELETQAKEEFTRRHTEKVLRLEEIIKELA